MIVRFMNVYLNQSFIQVISMTIDSKTIIFFYSMQSYLVFICHRIYIYIYLLFSTLHN